MLQLQGPPPPLEHPPLRVHPRQGDPLPQGMRTGHHSSEDGRPPPGTSPSPSPTPATYPSRVRARGRCLCPPRATRPTPRSRCCTAVGARCRGRCWEPGAPAWRRGHFPPLSASTGTRCHCSSALVRQISKDNLARARGIKAEELELDMLCVLVIHYWTFFLRTHATRTKLQYHFWSSSKKAYIDKPRPDVETRSPPHSPSVLCTSTGRRSLPVARAIVRCAIMGVPTRPQASPGHLSTRAAQAALAPALAPRRTPTAQTRQPAAVTGASI
jgi:hypothetical protein